MSDVPEEWRHPQYVVPYLAQQLRELNTSLLLVDQDLAVLEGALALDPGEVFSRDAADRVLTGITTIRGKVDELRVQLTGRTAALHTVAEELARG